MTAVEFQLSEVLFKQVFRPDAFKSSTGTCLADVLRAIAWDFMVKYGQKYVKKYKYTYADVTLTDDMVLVLFFRGEISKEKVPEGA